MTPAVNPYLPSYEYIPDAEPHIFGDRVYIYGSHDRFNAPIFCINDYVCWSAPVDNLSDWRYEGVIYKKNNDPRNRLGLRLLFAPDVCQGIDGRFYLFYAFDLLGIMGVAVSDSPVGKFHFHGHIHYKDGTLWGRKKGDQFPFDPGVLVDEDKKIWLYSGYARKVPTLASGGRKLKTDGGVVLELESDMLTIKTEPKLIFPKTGPGSYKDHEFFEASSIRKYGDTYYFVYSSKHNHELCYATSKYPDRDFIYKGTLVSIGDIFLNGNQEEKDGVNYLGNTHGGLLNIKNDWYIFYHRHTNRHSYSRQACAEKLTLDSNGDFKQAEVTSCGLNGRALPGVGTYSSHIACNLWSSKGVGRYDSANFGKVLKDHPYFTQSGHDRNNRPDQYIANMRDSSVCGFKYFDFKEASELSVVVSGNGSGRLLISDTKDFSSLCASFDIKCNSNKRLIFSDSFSIQDGIRPLYFCYKGTGAINFHEFTIKN